MSFLINRSIQTPVIRSETHDGREYWVAPVVLLVPDTVIRGSKGPLIYPASELAASAHLWEMIPITLDHPKDISGTHIPVNAEVLKRTQLGFCLNVSYDGRLKGEAWIDKGKAHSLDPRLSNLNATASPMEVSTGMTFSSFRSIGEVPIVTNMVPDHLAILPPGEQGACSCNAGCGLAVNSYGTGTEPLPQGIEAARIFNAGLLVGTAHQQPLWMQLTRPPMGQ